MNEPKEQKPHILFLPLAAIKQQPLLFITWVGVAVIIGSSGFWGPVLLEIMNGGEPWTAYSAVIENRILMGFAIVLLADGIGGLITALRAGNTLKTAGLRGLVGVCSILTLILCGWMSLPAKTVKISLSLFLSQHILAVSAIVIACYLYCFRNPEWEKPASAVKEEEEKAVNKVEAAANEAHSDDEGTKL